MLVLPEPEGPVIDTKSPSGMSSLILRSTQLRPLAMG